MAPKMNSDERPQKQSRNKKSAIVRWIVGGFFAVLTLVNGLHFSSLFLLLATFLMFPLSFMEAFLQKKNIKSVIAVVLSCVLFLIGILAAPQLEENEQLPAETTQTTASEDEKQKNDSTTSDNLTSNKEETTAFDSETTNSERSTTESDNSMSDDVETVVTDSELVESDDLTTDSDTSTINDGETTVSDSITSDDEKEEMVWIPSTGSKYHSKSSCSNMDSPRQVSLEEALKQGYTACKKCH